MGGQPVQQVIQTKIDPKTGKPTQVNTTLPAAAGAPQVITVVDPKTGKPVQQMVQTVVDPKTGKTVQIPVPTPPGAQIVMVPDPVTGKPVPQMVQTVVDPKTGKPTQVTTPLSNFTQSNGNCNQFKLTNKSKRNYQRKILKKQTKAK